MDFLNTKIIFLHFEFYNMFGLFTVNIWIKKSRRGEYPKYYWE